FLGYACPTRILAVLVRGAVGQLVVVAYLLQRAKGGSPIGGLRDQYLILGWRQSRGTEIDRVEVGPNHVQCAIRAGERLRELVVVAAGCRRRERERAQCLLVRWTHQRSLAERLAVVVGV